VPEIWGTGGCAAKVMGTRPIATPLGEMKFIAQLAEGAAQSVMVAPPDVEMKRRTV
jgi:hypothetical protein